MSDLIDLDGLDLSARFEIQFDDLTLTRATGSDDGRTLTGYAVPWDREARVEKPVRGWERFKRGALTKTITEQLSAGKPIPLYNLHREDKVAGKLVASHDDEFGQHVVFRLNTQPSGKEAAEMVRDGIWTGLSVGGAGIKARTKVARRDDGELSIERYEVNLDHVGLVRGHGALIAGAAYDGAGVLVLRSTDLPDGMDPDEAAEILRAHQEGRLVEVPAPSGRPKLAELAQRLAAVRA